jgi:hypothetical protein
MALKSSVSVRLALMMLAILLLIALPSGPTTDPSRLRRSNLTATIASSAIESRRVPRILVCIAAHWNPGRPTAYLDAVLDNFSKYAADFNVRIHVDTNSVELRDRLLARESPPEVRVWSVLELGDPLHLPYVHREIVANAADDIDFVIFSEDDILVPFAAFNRYVAHRQELQALGWSYGFVRAELWSVDNKTAISVDNIDPVVDTTVYEAVSGQRYAEPWSPYAAFYVLDASELKNMMDDPSGVWYTGFPPFLPRERMSIGYSYKMTGGRSEPYGAKGWRSRVLVPLSPQGHVHPDAVVWHLPQKYAKSAVLGFHDLGAVRVSDIFKWTAGKPPAIALPLGPLPADTSLL